MHRSASKWKPNAALELPQAAPGRWSGGCVRRAPDAAFSCIPRTGHYRQVMSTFLLAILVIGLVAGIAGGLAVLALAYLLPRKSCPKCSTLLPRFRKPANAREAMLGGWHCPSCGARIARDGSLLPGDA